jgi:putative Holliday junction resolvase
MSDIRHLGIDYGAAKVGLAVSDEAGRFAEPLEIVPNTDELIRSISDLAAERGVSVIVVGASRDLSGRENPIMERIRPFTERLREVSGCECVLEPEFYTTAQAARSGATSEVDASAAALILQSYLDRGGPAEAETSTSRRADQ